MGGGGGGIGGWGGGGGGGVWFFGWGVGGSKQNKHFLQSNTLLSLEFYRIFCYR